MINKISNKKGFTVLESLVAIGILTISISGAFSSVQQSLSQATNAKEEVKAFYLAQEAIEIIRNKRDSNQLAIINTGTGNWLTGISQNAGDPCFFGKTCRTDAKDFNLVDCGGGWGSCQNINQDQSTFLYNYDTISASNIATNFKREIQIESVNADEIAVTVKILWNKGSFKVKEYLFNWI